MNKKDLEKLGITDEEIQQAVIVLHGKNIEGLKAERDKALGDHQAVSETMTGLQQQLDEASATIEGFKKLDVSAIQQAADDYKAKYEQAQADAAAQLTKLKFDHALDGSLSKAKAKNVTAVKALLDIEGLTLEEDGSIKGLEDQLTSIQETNDFLFESDTQPPRIITGGKGGSVITDSTIAAARAAAGLEHKK